VTFAECSQDPATPEARTSEFAGRESFARTASSSTTNETARPLQGEDSSLTSLFNLQSSGICTDSPFESDLPVLPRSAANPNWYLSSSLPLAAFDFGLGEIEAENISEPNRPGCDTPPNTPALTHPNIADFKFPFPTLESTPEEASEGKKSEEPSLPAPSKGTGRAPRGLSSAIAQACRKFEPEAKSVSAEVGGKSSGKAFKRVGASQLELPSSPGPSTGFSEADIEEPALSEIARGKRPERRNSTPSRRRSSENMDLLNPESAVAMTQHRREAVRMAKSQEAAVIEKCKRSGVAAPQYTFDELIGKGSYGRVYKG
jgi:hypothetical protein